MVAALVLGLDDQLDFLCICHNRSSQAYASFGPLASLLLLFAIIAGGLACVEAVGNGEYLAALAFAGITPMCAVGFAVPFVSRRVKEWWW